MDSNNPVFTLNAVKEDIARNINNLQSFQHEDAVNDLTNVSDPIPVITIGGSPFAVKGDISIISGQPKAGKTSCSLFIIATALMKERSKEFDSLSIESTYCEGQMVFYIDTEQPVSYTNKLRKQVLKVIGADNHPANLGILNLRKYDPKTRKEKILKLMEDYPKAHLWIIDGVADLINDPNNTEESFGVIGTFMAKSGELDTAVVLYIHENPGTTGKLRGNLGSEAERKCGSTITIKKIKEKGIHSIEPKYVRGASDFESIYFRYDNHLGRMVSLDSTEVNEVKRATDKNTIKLNSRIQLASRCLSTGQLKFGDLVEMIVNVAKEIEGKSISKRTAEARVTELKEMEIINLNGDFYGLADKYIPQP